MSHTHWPGGAGPVCRFRTKKECDEAYVTWQAEREVELAARIVTKGDAKRHRKSEGVFDQLVQVMAGERETITNKDGNESDQPFARRLLAALATHRGLE